MQCCCVQNAVAQHAFPAKKEIHVSTTQTALAQTGLLDRGAIPPTFFCFISDDCGVNMDSVTGKAGKCLQICAQDLVFNAKSEERTGLHSPAEKKGSSSQHGNGNQLHPDCMEGWQCNYRVIKKCRTLSIVCHIHTSSEVTVSQPASALSWLETIIISHPNLDTEHPQSPPKHEV